MAIIQFELNATDNVDEAEFFWRTSATSGVTDAQRMVIVENDEDDHQPRLIEYFLELDADGNFQYLLDNVVNAPTGAIRLMGYW